MKPVIVTSRYRASHMKAPRGRGLWLFEMGDGTVVVSHNGSFAEARKAAIAYCREHKLAGLFVCP